MTTAIFMCWSLASVESGWTAVGAAGLLWVQLCTRLSLGRVEVLFDVQGEQGRLTAAARRPSAVLSPTLCCLSRCARSSLSAWASSISLCDASVSPPCCWSSRHPWTRTIRPDATATAHRPTPTAWKMVDTTTTAAATPPQQRAAGARIEKSEPRAEGTGRRPRVATRAASTLTTAPCVHVRQCRQQFWRMLRRLRRKGHQLQP